MKIFALRKQDTGYHIVLLTIAVIYSLLAWHTPLGLDDWMFMGVYHDHNGPGNAFDIGAWIDYIAELRANDNSRISNMMSIFTTTIEPWCGFSQLLTGPVVAFILYMILRLTRITTGRGRVAAILWIAMVIFLPWRDSLLVRDYTLNYFYSGAISLLFIGVVLRQERRGWSVTGILLTAVLAIVAGGWHEGFSLPLCAGMVVWTLVKRFRMSRGWYVVGVAYGVATLAFALSPGLLHRAGVQVSASQVNFNYKFWADNLLTGLTLCLLIASMCLQRGRRHMAPLTRNPLFVIMAVAMVTGLAMNFMIRHFPRMSFWPSICSMIVLMLYFRAWIEVNCRRLWAGIMAVACYMACVAHGVVSVMWQIRLDREADDIVAQFDTGTDTVFYDIVEPDTFPVYTLYFPEKKLWVTPFNYFAMCNYYKHDSMAVVPRALRDADEGNSTRLEGNLGVMAKDGALWGMLPDDLATMDNPTVNVTLRDGTVLCDRLCLILRYTGEDGKKRHYMKIFKLPVEQIRGVDW